MRLRLPATTVEAGDPLAHQPFAHRRHVLRILFNGIMAGGWFALLVAPSLADSQNPPSRMAAAAPDLATLVAPRVFSSPELDNESAGLAPNSRPEVLTWERVFTLALVHFRGGDSRIADALVPAQLAARAKQHGVDDFTRFRTDFLTGRPGARGMFRDPCAEYLELLRRSAAITSERRDLAFDENLLELMRGLIQGESGGLSQLDVDRVSVALLRARQRFTGEVGRFRNELDQMKVGLGLSPRAAIVPDRRVLANFGSAFEGVDNWFRSPGRNLAELHTLVERLPSLGSVVVGGRPVRGGNPNALDELLTNAARLAIKNQGIRNEGPSREDDQIQLELRVRRQLRRLLETQIAYDGEKHGYELAARLKDQAFERLVTSSRSAPSSRSALLGALLDHAAEIRQAEIRLVGLWTNFRAQRLALYREIGALPYDNWISFYEDLSTGAAIEAGRPDAPRDPPAAGAGRQPPVPVPGAGPQTSPPAPAPPGASPTPGPGH